MKVTNTGVSQTSLPAAPPAPGTAPVQRDASVDASAPENDTYTPSAEWTRLLDLVQQEPEIREDRVRDAIRRLHQGDYLSAESAAKTADAMLHALD